MANLAATISVLCQLTQSAVLKFAPTWIQILKELVYAFAYILLGFLLLKQFGLYGFCIAAIVANLVKLITLYILGNKYIGKKE